MYSTLCRSSEYSTKLYMALCSAWVLNPANCAPCSYPRIPTISSCVLFTSARSSCQLDSKLHVRRLSSLARRRANDWKVCHVFPTSVFPAWVPFREWICRHCASSSGKYYAYVLRICTTCSYLVSQLRCCTTLLHCVAVLRYKIRSWHEGASVVFPCVASTVSVPLYLKFYLEFRYFHVGF